MEFVNGLLLACWRPLRKGYHRPLHKGHHRPLHKDHLHPPRKGKVLMHRIVEFVNEGLFINGFLLATTNCHVHALFVKGHWLASNCHVHEWDIIAPRFLPKMESLARRVVQVRRVPYVHLWAKHLEVTALWECNIVSRSQTVS